MKIKIFKTDLDKHISIAQKAISNKSLIQILEGILFIAKNNQLTLASTDLELSIETKVDCEVIEEGAIVIDSNMIGNLVKKLPNDIITLTVNNDKVNIKCQHSNFDINCQSPIDYPALPQLEKNPVFTLDNKELIKAVKETLFATSNDETRIEFTGIYLQVNDNVINFVGSDGYRIALKKIHENINKNISCIVPKRAFSELVKILDLTSTDVTIIEGHILFSNGNTKMYSRLIDNKYFDYNRAILDIYETKIRLNRNDLLNSLERALLLTRGNNASLTKFNFNGNKLNISSNSDFGNFKEVIEIEKEGNDLEIGFNTKYMLDGLRVIEDDEIVIYLNSPVHPLTIYPTNEYSDYLYLLLPVKISR